VVHDAGSRELLQELVREADSIWLTASRRATSSARARLEAAEVVVELGTRLRADERHDHAGPLAHPVRATCAGVRPIFSATWITSAAIPTDRIAAVRTGTR